MNDIEKINKDNEKLIGIDNWIIDLSFLGNYIEKAIEIFRKNTNQAQFIQTRILLDKYWTNENKSVNSTLKFILMNKENIKYILNNIFLYDDFIFYKINVKNYNEEGVYKNSITIHPILFLINLAILLFIKDRRKNNKYSSYVYCRYNTNYNEKNIDFSSTNKDIFEENYDKNLKLWKNVIKLNVKDFFNSITESTLKKYIYKNYDIKWQELEIIINYTKYLCSDGIKVIPTHEFSPLYSYLATSCVLDGILEEITDSSKEKFFLMCYLDDIYVFFNDYKFWNEIKTLIENVLFNNNLEINNLKIEIKKQNGIIKKSKRNKNFYYFLLEYLQFHKNYSFRNSNIIFLDFLNTNKIISPFHNKLISSIASEKDYKRILKFINNMSNEWYFRIIDSNPKYFIKFFYLLDREYNKGERDYLLNKLVSKFSENKNNSSIVNDDYYIYYYLYNSFQGLYKNNIDDNKLIIKNNIYYVNFKNFIFSIYDETKYSYFYDNFELEHDNVVASLMFFLKFQFKVHKYNDCILIVSAIYDLLKKEFNKCIKSDDNSDSYESKFNKFLSSELLKKYKIEPIDIKDWTYINKLRNSLTSCHLNRNKKTNIDFSLDTIKEKLDNIIKWIFNYKIFRANNNLNKLLYCLTNETKLKNKNSKKYSNLH